MIFAANSRRAAVTLIEVTISIVLVSTILLVSITASSNLRRNHHDARDDNHGLSIAHQFLDEISAMDFRDSVDPVFGLESGESATDRTTFDDVDDYHNYSQNPPTHRDGSAIAGADNWSISVSIVAADPDSSGVVTVGATPTSPLRIVTVTCTAPSGESVDSSTLVSEVPSDRPVASSYERWRRVKLQFSNRDVEITAPLRNQPDPI